MTDSFWKDGKDVEPKTDAGQHPVSEPGTAHSLNTLGSSVPLSPHMQSLQALELDVSDPQPPAQPAQQLPADSVPQVSADPVSPVAFPTVVEKPAETSSPYAAAMQATRQTSPMNDGEGSLYRPLHSQPPQNPPVSTAPPAPPAAQWQQTAPVTPVDKTSASEPKQ
ncbi:MAG TPA: hypothetical protein DEB24_04190, partial [Coriobacteriia bacterium]|nr:hypothetical protein [Coriobacteriia bacterium]